MSMYIYIINGPCGKLSRQTAEQKEKQVPPSPRIFALLDQSVDHC